jgi:hypothetical protein
VRDDENPTVIRPAADPSTQPTLVRTIERHVEADATQLRAPSPRGSGSGEPPAAGHSATAPATSPVNRPVTQTGTPGSGGPALHRLAPGDVIKDRFVLEESIGQGAMGVVFTALDLRKQEANDPNPHVAIKILSADFREHPHALVTLQRESRKAQALAHPNVVTVFDFDRDGDMVFMTMELLKGRPLDAIVREAYGVGIGRAAALPIIRGIAEGLAYAHRKGIIHSDLKPGNVFLTEDGVPKILDFGIARAAPNSGADKDTFDAGVLGAYTEAYATEEMVDGAEPHPSDDLYALGLIACELLSGAHPYQRHSATRARSLGLRPEPPKGLKKREWKAIERCLAWERARRPKDAAEFLRSFAGVSPLQKWLIAAVAVLAAAAGGLAYTNYQRSGPAVAFSALPEAVQREFESSMAAGDKEWAFYEKDHNFVALLSAAEHYSKAYDLHPRNRRATRALEAIAKAFLQVTKDNPEVRRQGAKALTEMSPYFSRHAPLTDAAAGVQ